ncbi:MAG: sugar transferase [Acidobacteria bacterium]|nr:sugar transferase [Acidobacteriota bacterium]
MLDLRFKGFRIEEASTTFEHICHRVCSKDLRPAQLIFYGSRGPRPYGYRAQGLVNFLVAAFGFLVALPIMAITAVLVKLTSPGPVFFSQERVGLNNRVFKLYKFRSMRADAEKNTGAVWATRNDPRVTSIGKWLRKLRIDELPQLINVLKGEMSMVGPRPERPEFVDQLARQIPYYRQRLAVRPGVTGWAQINHKYGDTLEDTIRKVEYDLYYIKHIAFTLDIYIIFHTIKTMLLRRGAQ